MNKYDNYEWTSIVANKPRKDILYFEENNSSSLADIGDIVTYYGHSRMAAGPLVAIEEKIVDELYTINMVIDVTGRFIGLSVEIPDHRYSDCTVTISLAQDQERRLEKVAVGGFAYFQGNYV